MARAIWRGSISFGLVTIPVRLYTAVRKHDVRFREVDRISRRPLHHERVREIEELPRQAEREIQVTRPSRPEAVPTPPPQDRREAPVEVMRGFEVSPGAFVEVSDEELSELAPERSRSIEVEQFISRKDLDAIYFESAYYVVPDRDRARPFALLLKAMQQTNRAAVCWLVLRSRRHLAALEPRGRLMLLWTLYFSDEVVSPGALEPTLPDDLGEREVEMAELLVQTLSGPFEPERYRDEYRERLLALIERKSEQAPFEAEPGAPPATSGVEDLMAALSASIEQARRSQRDRKSQTG
jgi:DNA end-binding protein Ku